jgi:hypothetical protein
LPTTAQPLILALTPQTGRPAKVPPRAGPNTDPRSNDSNRNLVNYHSTGRGALAATGIGTVTIGGIAFEQLWLLGAALLLVTVGAVAIRVGWRRNKGISE